MNDDDKSFDELEQEGAPDADIEEILEGASDANN